MEKLYSAHSFVHGLKGRSDVFVDWFKFKGNLGKVDYSTIIKEYDQLPEDEQANAEDRVNELFTSEEIEILRKYLLETHDCDLFVREVYLPLPSKNPKTGRVYTPYWDLAYASNTITIGNADNQLPFELWGFYNWDACPPADKLPGEMIDYGLEFIEKVLKQLVPQMKLTDDSVRNVIKNLYEVHGYYVLIDLRGPTTRNSEKESTESQ